MQIVANLKYISTDGEKFLINFLVENLSDDFEIYIQPNLNGNRPDIILCHKNKGIFIIEIKDWKIERYEKDEEKDKYYKYFKNKKIEIANPNSQLKRYKEQFNIFKQTPVVCIHYFHHSITQDVVNFLGEDGIKIFGFDKKNDLIAFVSNYPNIMLKYYKQIKNFISPEKHKKELGEKIYLTQQQKRLIEHTPNSWRRVKGSAGSGKTLVVVQKAVNIANADKKVLIVCFNKTLKRYIKDQLNNTFKDFDWNLIEYNHFHGFAKLFVEENGLEVKSNGNFEEYEKNLIELVLKLQNDCQNVKNRKYDAILIDEAQDFKKEWFDILLYFLSENNEILLVADDKQNLYDRDVSWIKESMGGYGYQFKGVWGILKESKRSWRLPNLIQKTNNFFELFLKKYLIEHPDKNFGDFLNLQTTINENILDFQPLIWENINKDNLHIKILHYCKSFINEKYKPKDITILVLNKNIGNDVKFFLSNKGVNTKDMFSSKEDFSLNNDEITISTINSFKGMENKIIIFVSEDINNIQNDFKTYVALTRAKEALVVLNKNQKYLEYSKEWI